MAQSSVGPVFMSYSRKDEEVMWRIVRFLRGKGIKVWVDNEKLIPGTPIWEDEIEKAIKGASSIVVVLSPEAKSSEWVKREISLADQNRKRIFPVLVSGDEDLSITLRLITRQYVDLRENVEEGLNSLLAGLSQYLNDFQSQLEQKARAESEKSAQDRAELDAREVAEKLGQAKTERTINESKLTEKIKLDSTKGQSTRFYRIWWSALTKPTEANYQKLIEDPNVSQKKAYWWVFIAGVLFSTMLIIKNIVPGAILYIPSIIIIGAIQVFNTIDDPANLVTPAEAIKTALQTALEQIKEIFELLNIPSMMSVFSLLDAIIKYISVPLFFVAIIMIHAFVTTRVSKARGGQGDFTKMVYLLAAFSAPAIIGSSIIVGLMPTGSLLFYFGLVFIIPFAGFLYPIILGIIATKVVNKLTWGNAVVPSLVFPLILLILPLHYLSGLDSRTLNAINNTIIGNTRP